MTSIHNASGLAGKTISQLRELANRLRLKEFSRMSKAELIEQLSEPLKASGLPTQASESTSIHGISEMGGVAIKAAHSTHVVFLPRDPHWAYVFWEITEPDQQLAEQAGAQQLCLRVADVTGLPLGDVHPHTLQEVVVDTQAHEWFLPVPMSDRDYRVELGFRLAQGGWFSLAKSSIARVPALEPTHIVDDRFVPFSLDTPITSEPMVHSSGGVEHELLYQRATAISTSRRRVGSEMLHEHAFSRDQSGELHDSGAGLWASGRNESGSGLLRQRSFWLVADAELIVYGATEPSASLFIGDEAVPLDADGTFRVHVPFKDGEQLYPIRAIAADGEQERSIRLEFQRRTPQARVNSKEEANTEWF